MAEDTPSFQSVAKREFAVFLALFFCGLVLLPILIYVVGQQIFGSYRGDGFGSFFAGIIGKILSGQFYAWLLVLSPYLTWHVLRLMFVGWRAAGTSS